jgi:hypothetical protein
VSPTNVLNDVEVTVEDSAVVAALDEPEEVEPADLDHPMMVAPVVIPPTQMPTEDESISPQRKRVLENLIGMADLYARNGSVRQAMELYFELVIEHDGSDQSILAYDRLVAIAQRYECRGELRQARGIYERLLKAS